METLSKLFGSELKVKIMRLFLFNPETVFDVNDIAVRVQDEVSRVKKEINNLERIGFVKKRSSNRAVHTNSNTKKRVNGHGYSLDSQFSYLVPLQNFLINVEPLQPKELIQRFSRLGAVKLIIVAGVFIQEAESRLDLLVVGDHIKKAALDHTIKTMEAEIGKELRYAYFSTEDFKYRLSMFDKLIRDILDYPHKKILNKFGIL